MKTIDKVVAANIRRRRVKMGLSQRALAKLANLTPISLNKIEMASRPAGKSAIESIASALACSVDELYRSSENNESALDARVLEAIERGVAHVTGRNRIVEPSPSYNSLSESKQELIDLIREMPDSRIRTLIDMLSIDTSSILGDEKNAAPRKRR